MSQVSHIASFRGSNNYGPQVGQNLGQLIINQSFEQEHSIENQCLQTFRLQTGESYEWYKNLNQDRVGETCQWFLRHPNYISWKVASSGPLLVTADPGCGKSVLAKHLIDHELPGLVCYYFFKEGDQNTLKQALCALLHQLFTQRRILIKNALTEFSANGLKLVSNTDLLGKILGKTLCDSETGPVTLVLDALDECRPHDVKHLLQVLREQITDDAQQATPIKMIFTTRPYSRVVSEFWDLISDLPKVRIPGEEEDGSHQISKEIDYVIEHRVDQAARKFKLGPLLRSHLRQRLLTMTHRTYLWLDLVFDHLDQGFRKTEAGVSSVIDTLPETVYEAYEKILRRSINEQQAMRVLSIMLAAERPFTLKEMNIAANIDSSLMPRSLEDLDLESEEDFKSTLRDWCGLFISIYDSKVYFLHQTAKEFLQVDSVPSPRYVEMQRWRGSIAIESAHVLLLEICLTSLLLYELDDQKFGPHERSYLGRSGPAFHLRCEPSDREMDRIERGYSKIWTPAFQYHLFEYAAEYWVRHYHKAGSLIRAETDLLARRVCEQARDKTPQWLFYMNNGLLSLSYLLPWTLACLMGLHGVVQLLIAEEDCNFEDERNNTPLYYAAYSAHHQVVTLLLSRGADINMMNQNGHTALHKMMLDSRPDGMRCLLDNGAYVDTRDRHGATPLQMASRAQYTWSEQHSACIDLLLDRGADVYARDEQGDSALRLAARKGCSAFVQILLDRSVEIDDRDPVDRTALFLAIDGDQRSMVRLLLDHGANLNAKTRSGETALIYAASLGESALVYILCGYGARISDGEVEEYENSPVCRKRILRILKRQLRLQAGTEDALSDTTSEFCLDITSDVDSYTHSDSLPDEEHRISDEWDGSYEGTHDVSSEESDRPASDTLVRGRNSERHGLLQRLRARFRKIHRSS